MIKRRPAAALVCCSLCGVFLTGCHGGSSDSADKPLMTKEQMSKLPPPPDNPAKAVAPIGAGGGQ